MTYSTYEQGTSAVKARKAPRAPSESRLAAILNTPAVILILVLLAFPIANSLWISLHRYDLKRPGDTPFIGLKNYTDALSSDAFWHSLKVTGLFAFFAVLGVTATGIAIALLLNESFKGRGILRSLILLPWAMPPVVNGIMWAWIFNGRYGAFNGLLYDLGLIDAYRLWLTDIKLAWVVLVFAYVWNQLPFVVIVMLSALQAIPNELYDAARVDRANTVQAFFNVTLPWLWQALLIVLILQTMGALRIFDIVYVMTSGGPGNATDVVAWLTWRTAFQFLDFGKGNTYAIIVSVITLALAVLYIKVLLKRGEFAV